MGVTGLWRLIEPAGKPVPVETLENKVLAVDISIWLHQMVKGYQDAKGAPLPNAHLMGLFQRLCKLLYFRIKPVFVFDGGFPDLKKETIGKRQDNKTKYNSESERLKREIALLLGKKTAIGSLLGKQLPQKKSNIPDNNDDIFKLPALPEKEQESESESEDERSTSGSGIDLHTVDLESAKFKSLPAKEKYDLLVDLKETRKMNSWGKLHTLPKKSDNFSDFQMQRLLKRRKVQECLEETEKEIGEVGMSFNELESLLNDEGIDTKFETFPSRRIASNETTRYLLISNVKQVLAEAKRKNEESSSKEVIEDSSEIECEKNIKENTSYLNEKPSNDNELEADLEKAIKMSLECVEDHEITASTSKTDDSWTSNLTDSDFSDSEDEDGFVQSDISCAKAYIMQYSDFTNKAIDNLVISKHNDRKKSKGSKVDKIIEELNKEKSIIEKHIELSSGEEDDVNNDKNVLDLPSSYNNDIFTNESKILETPPLCTSKNNENSTSDSSAEKMNSFKLDSNFISRTANQFEKLSEIKGNATESKYENACYLDSQESVVSLETTTEIISLDSSMEERSSNAIETEIISNIKTDSKNEEANYMKSQLSVTCLKPKAKIVSLESNVEEINDCNKEVNELESSEDEFEEVPETENKFKLPVVQLTLNMNETLQDDIFADIFGKNLKSEVVKKISAINISEENTNKNASVVILEKETQPEIYENTKILNVNKESGRVGIPETSENVQTSNDPLNKKSVKVSIPETTSTQVLEVRDNQSINIVSKEELSSLVTEMDDKHENLLQEKARLDRIGRNITEQMTKEAQELLQIFGIPYVVAPMEAEAQCAFLEIINLTDGTITDDSDIWLFGGQTVYKNFFNQKKHVLQYQRERIEKSFNLTREQLVLLALLVGSDYTTGVTGVGPVTALEILASFPFNKKKLNESTKQERYQEIIKGLIDFKKWVKAGKRTDNVSLKKKLKNVTLTEDFPSTRVVQAYLEPNVERSEEKFTWGELDITVLRDYTKNKFGWSQNKLDEIIKPVLKRMQDRKNQKTVHDYFKRKTEFLSLEDQMSKRVKAAVNKMGPNGPLEDENEKTKPVLKRKLGKSKNSSKSGDTKETGLSAAKQQKNDDVTSIQQVVKMQEISEREQNFNININKTQTLQEIIPQREKDKQNMLQNKLKAIEAFRKTKIDRKTRTSKRRLPQPKADAGLSESDSD